MTQKSFSSCRLICLVSLITLFSMASINVIGSNPGNDQASKWNMASAAMDPLKGDSEEKTGWSEDKGAGPMRAAPTQVLSTDAQLLGVTHEYTNTTPLAIPDGQCPTTVTSTITVPDTFAIADLNVGLWIAHTWRSDVNVTLTSPTGTTVQLVQDADSSADNLNVLLDDSSANAPDSANHNVPPPYYYVTWHPTGNLADFNFQQAAGTWTLSLCDDSGTDTGTLNQWTLYFTTGLDIAPSQEASACEGNTIDYIFSVMNTTGTAQAFSLSYSSVWPYTGPAATGTIADGASENITVSVTVPGSSNPMDQDVLTVTASGGGDTSQATATTTAALASGWTDVASVTAGRGVRDHSVVYYNGKLYKIGGYNGAATAFLDIYDIATDTWSAGADMPAARYWIDAVAIDGKIYVAGGYLTSAQSTLYIYDIATNAWVTGAAMPAARYAYSGAAYNGIYYVIGGYTTTYTNTIIAYDPATNTWNSGLPNMTNARRYPFSGVIGGMIYVTGGITGSSTYTNTTEVFNPATSTWSTAASLPATGWVRSADAVINDRYLLIAGGFSADATASAFALVYDAVLDQWASLPDMSHMLYAAEADGDGTNMWIASGRLYEGSWSYGLYTTRLDFCPSIAPENTAYYASTWGDNAVHYLDENMNDLGSFPTCTQPNGLATDGTYIYSGCFSGSQVIGYDLNGVQQFSWTDSTYLNGLQAMEMVGSELAVYDNDMIHFLNPMTGAFIREIPAAGSVEGLAYDGQYLWELNETTIIAINPADGTEMTTIPNAASGCTYEGTGLTTGAAGELVIGCPSGAWYRVSSTDGSVLASGNNGLQIYGLGSVAGTGGCATITIAPATLPAGTVGAAYNQTLTASGGTAPYTYAITMGTLPPGLSLGSTTGVISGTPTTGGTYTFTITATDSAACTGTITYTMDFSYGWNMSVVDDAGRSSACLNTDTGYYAWTVLTGFGAGTYVGHSNVTFTYNTYYFQSGKPSGMNMKVSLTTNRASGTYMSPPLREKSICIDADITDNPACP